MNILLYHFGYRGDILVVGQNFTRELLARYPKAEIDLMVRPRMAEVRDFMGPMGLYRSILLGEKKDYRGLKAQYDLAFIVDENVYPEGNLRTPFTKAGFPFRQHRLSLTVTPEDSILAERIVAGLARPIIATQSDMNRKWAADKVMLLWKQIYDLGSLLIVGPEERYPGIDRPLTFRESAALVAQADLFIGIDSGIAHAAALVGVKTILMPPVFPEFWISPTEYANPFIVNEVEKHVSIRPSPEDFCGHYCCLKPTRSRGIAKGCGDPMKVKCVWKKSWGFIKDECCFQSITVDAYLEAVRQAFVARGLVLQI